MKENLYEVLELNNFANMNEIRDKYRELIKINHPDKGGKAENFEKIKKAYETLKSEESKADYDKKLKYIVEIIEKSEILASDEYEVNYANNQFGENDNLKAKVELLRIDFPCKQCFSENSIKVKKNEYEDKDNICVLRCECCSLFYRIVS